jgi:hypothetical protein
MHFNQCGHSIGRAVAIARSADQRGKAPTGDFIAATLVPDKGFA